MDYKALPDSTGAIVWGLLRDDVDVATAVHWARDLWQDGLGTDRVQALAVLDANERDAVRSAVSDIANEIGLLAPGAGDYWSERWLLSRFIDGTFSDLDLMSAGFGLWLSFRELSGESAPNPFDPYFALDLDAYEITQGAIEDVPVDKRRPWVIRKLVAAEVFARSGLQPPAA